MSDQPKPFVQVFGDSLAVQADTGGALQRALEAAGFEADVGPIVGVNLPFTYEQLWPERDVDAGPPDVLVIALGTNDSHDGAIALSDSRAALEDWLDEVPDACVVLVGVNERTPEWGLDVHGPPFNEMLADVAAARGDAEVVPWEPEPSMLDEDGIHLSEEGAAAYRRAIVEGVERCGGG